MKSSITIRQRLIALVVFLGLALLGVSAIALRDMAAAVRGLETVYLDRVVPLKDLKADSLVKGLVGIEEVRLNWAYGFAGSGDGETGPSWKGTH